jgi:hypothetical protein
LLSCDSEGYREVAWLLESATLQEDASENAKKVADDSLKLFDPASCGAGETVGTR